MLADHIRTAAIVVGLVLNVAGGVALGYVLGRRDAPPPPPPPPRACPAPNAEACMAVWFGGEPGDMLHARKRACSRR